MRTIIHLSDLHFGRIDPQLLAPLTELAWSVRPDLLVVSGDLTQRARSEQFKAAREFLDRLPSPQIVVPGNHDIPLHNVFSRFMQPLAKYRRYINDDIEPVHIDDEIAVVGINTARSLTIKDGRINAQQVARARALLCGLPEHVIKIIVTHHPFDLPEHYDAGDLVGRAPIAMNMFASCGANLLLAGHLHASHAGSTAARYRIGDYSALVVQAGTATSTRGRGEANSFNVIRTNRSAIAIERFSWSDELKNFTSAALETFERMPNGWTRATGKG